MNAFERLGLPLKLALDQALLSERVTAESRLHHPDAGGDESVFREIRKAGEVLSVPALRIREALVVAGGDPSERGEVPSEVMDLFASVAGVLEEVSGFVSKRAKALSGLGRAVLDAGLPVVKGRLEQVTAEVAGREAELISRFARIDEWGWENCLAEMGEVSRGLAFLRKWLGQLREAHGRLFEALLGG
jgi:hypothetical protein